MPETLDPTTGYPPGYTPTWWRCKECGGLWHDEANRGDNGVAWDCDAECGNCRQRMVRVSGWRAALLRLAGAGRGA
jgi:hypothetical protein